MTFTLLLCYPECLAPAADNVNDHQKLISGVWFQRKAWVSPASSPGFSVYPGLSARVVCRDSNPDNAAPPDLRGSAVEIPAEVCACRTSPQSGRQPTVLGYRRGSDSAGAKSHETIFDLRFSSPSNQLSGYTARPMV
ncbi:hypothetical protein PoB_001928900 [Plakobranchus ocellatus]|uniref:Uncharacterized protein n=1 Tax=Plakobranchus ocellatus TaxID=259542 RepID=A0AAV3ZFW1_9GAST|nr:hypothetical protein PoB_001928900 [Plakobranchus ocellatus]